MAPKKWIRTHKLGEGKYATVFLATNQDNGKRFVVKSADRTSLEKRLAMEVERKILRECDSPYVVKYLGCGNTDSVKEMGGMDTFNIYLEWVPRGSVLEHMRRNGGALEEAHVAAYAKELLKGLSYLHGKGIVHGDVKAANMLVGNENLKLCDLGSGKLMADGDVRLPPKVGMPSNQRRIFVTGTDGYMAPEVEAETAQSPPSDIYSLGCTIVEMCTGLPPERVPAIYTADDDDIDPQTGEPRCTIDVPPNFSDDCRAFVDACLREDPNDRPTAADLMRHRWFKNIKCPYPVGLERPGPSHQVSRASMRCGGFLGCC